MQQLEKMLIEVNQRLYGDQQGFQYVYRIVTFKRGKRIITD